MCVPHFLGIEVVPESGQPSGTGGIRAYLSPAPQAVPPGALSPLRQLRGALPRGGRYTKGAGDRPSGNLTQGSCGLLAEEGFFFGSVNRKSIFLARPIYGFHWNMF